MAKHESAFARRLAVVSGHFAVHSQIALPDNQEALVRAARLQSARNLSQ